MKTQLIAILMFFLSSNLLAAGDSDGFTPTATQVDWLKVDRKAIGDRLDQIKAEIAAKRKLADQQSQAAKAMRKKQFSDLFSSASEDPIVMAAHRKELGQAQMSASQLDESVKALQEQITDLTWEETKLGRDIRRATSEQVGELVKREQAAEDAQKEAARVKREADLAAEKARAAREKQFQQALETMAVTQSFQSLQSIVNDTNRTLDEIEHKYDQALLGAYMKDKMTALLNSKAFCSAAVNCELSAKDKKPIGPEMNEVFPWSDPKQDRTQPRSGKTTR